MKIELSEHDQRDIAVFMAGGYRERVGRNPNTFESKKLSERYYELLKKIATPIVNKRGRRNKNAVQDKQGVTGKPKKSPSK
jgi:hypothetical protein